MILAAIDIGSNAVRLLISEAAPYHGAVSYTKLLLLRIPLRLGFDVFSGGVIGEDKQGRLIESLQAFRHLMHVYKVDAWRACATSAMRDARNREAILAAVKQQTGMTIEVISGQEEASIFYQTHIAEQLNTGKSYLYIDVGGGSTEVILFSGSTTVFQESFNIGTIRLLHNQVKDELWEDMKRFIKTRTQSHHPIAAIGTGGNINKIFSLSKRKEGKPLTLELLKDYYNELKSVTVEERMHLYRLRADRADVIVPALQIYTSVMRWAGSDVIYVPKIGLADGLVQMLYREKTGGS
jgi:exopolyphosphatase/guanosine-5'-triphosphate,3'-diphosphate pyrophosphatase